MRSQFRCQRSGGTPDVVWSFTRADLQLLTSRRPQAVHAAYLRPERRLAEQHGADTGFPMRSAAAHCRLYRDLGILTENAQSALQALDAHDERRPRPRALASWSSRATASMSRVGQSLASRARRSGRRGGCCANAVAGELSAAAGGPVEGIAGGASGGDILFHEVCADLDIPTTLALALPPGPFAAASVVDAGPAWVERFNRLCGRGVPRVLGERSELPKWLARRRGYTIWERNNRWLLHLALGRVHADVTLIVLWDGAGGDGPDGTEGMVRLARARGVKVVHLDTAQLLGAGQVADA
jgi:hypothetical protein